MKPTSIVLCLAGLAAAAGGASLLALAGPTHAASPLKPDAPVARSVPAATAPSSSARVGLAAPRPITARPGEPLGEAALAAIRANALEQVAQERGRILFERQLIEGDWLRVLGNEVAASVGLDASAGPLLGKILVTERDEQSALWEEVRGIRNKRASRERLAEGMQAIRARKLQALEKTFGPERVAELLELLDNGGPGVDGEPGALARAGY